MNSPINLINENKGIDMDERRDSAWPQIKICGLTVPQEAAACADAGANAIGLVFYPPSKRYVTLEQARAVSDALPAHVPAVGVFVDPSWEELVQTVDQCRLGGIQLHGAESPEFIQRLRQQYAFVLLKGVFVTQSPWLSEAGRFAATAYLVECGQGALPGGNAQTWDWGAAREFALTHPTVLAGGLSPDNVAEAIAACLPDAVDASSALEAGPGRKDLTKVERFIAQVRGTAHLYQAGAKSLRPIFTQGG